MDNLSGSRVKTAHINKLNKALVAGTFNFDTSRCGGSVDGVPFSPQLEPLCPEITASHPNLIP